MMQHDDTIRFPRTRIALNCEHYIVEWNMPKKTKAIIAVEEIVNKIIVLRGERVMVDHDLAEMYGVETRVLKQAVRRNIDRFPDDFMFELTKKEQNSLRSQTVILKRGQHSKYPPFAFTEQVVAMLSSVLNSDRAITVNIEIMRTFTRLRSMIATHDDLKRKIEVMEKKYDKQFRIVFEAITQLIEEDERPKKKIGYIKEGQTKYGKNGRKN